MPREKGGARKAGGATGASDDDGTSLTLTQRIEAAQDQAAAAASHAAALREQLMEQEHFPGGEAHQQGVLHRPQGGSAVIRTRTVPNQEKKETHTRARPARPVF